MDRNNKKKKLGILLLLIIFVLGGCGEHGSVTTKENITPIPEKEVMKESPTITETVDDTHIPDMEDENIEVEKETYSKEDIVKWKTCLQDKIEEFNKIKTDDLFEQSLWLEDINEDGLPELGRSTSEKAAIGRTGTFGYYALVDGELVYFSDFCGYDKDKQCYYQKSSDDYGRVSIRSWYGNEEILSYYHSDYYYVNDKRVTEEKYNETVDSIDKNYKFVNNKSMVYYGDLIKIIEDWDIESTYNESTYTDRVVDLKEAKIGDVVLLGAYEQDNNLENGAEKIAWYVIDKDEDNCLLMSVYLLDYMSFHDVDDTNYSAGWTKSNIRKWLNEDFYKNSFSYREKILINETSLSTSYSGDTKDFVYLLSREEIVDYSKENKLRHELFTAEATNYSFSKQIPLVYYDEIKEEFVTSVYDEPNGIVTPIGYGEWLTRTNYAFMGDFCPLDGIEYVNDEGNLGTYGKYTYELAGVRPVMWVNTNNDTLKLEENFVDDFGYKGKIVHDISQAQLGDVISFGKYEQDNIENNGKENILWYVVERDEQRNCLKLLSMYVLDTTPDGTNESWETSSVRTWLNSEFYDAAFSSTEKNQIYPVTMWTEENPVTGLETTYNFQDKVRSMSYSELQTLYNVEIKGSYIGGSILLPDSYYGEYYDAILLGIATPYAFFKGLTLINPDNGMRLSNDKYSGYHYESNYHESAYAQWWLSTQGKKYNTMMYVKDTVNFYGTSQEDAKDIGIRPFIFIEID